MAKFKRVIALIPARGGSKRVRNKNKRVVGTIEMAKPLVGWACEAALGAGIDRVVVSTDEFEIGEIANNYGASWQLRPKSLATDESLVLDMVLNFAESTDFNTLALIQCTTPLMGSEYLKRAVALVTADPTGDTCAISVVKATGFYHEPGSNFSKTHGRNRQRTQDFLLWRENGAFYITSRKRLLKERTLLGPKTTMIEMPQWRSFEIDTLEDLQIVETIAENYHKFDE